MRSGYRPCATGDSGSRGFASVRDDSHRHVDALWSQVDHLSGAEGGLRGWEGNDVLRSPRRPLRCDDVLQRGHRHIDRTYLEDRSLISEARVAVGESVRNETQIEGTMVRDQGHRLDRTQHLRVRLEPDTVRDRLRPEAARRGLPGRGEPPQVVLVRRRADVNVDGGMPGGVEASCHASDDHEPHP